MALSNNPNQSRGIENRWRIEINTRWRKFTRLLTHRLNNLSELTLNISSYHEQQAFINEIEAFIEINMLGDNWQNKYQNEIYEKTAEKAENTYQKESNFHALAQDSLIFTLLFGLFDNPAQVNETHRNELGFLHERANDALKAAIEKLRRDIKQIIDDNRGVSSPKELAKLISERVEISKNSALRIARTEINQAAQRAVINTSQIIQLITGQEVKVRWITINDLKVRHLHAQWHGKVMTKKEAKNNFNLNPWNCRCALRLVTKEADTQKTQKAFNIERDVLMGKQKQKKK
jgi:SPP1 gp7 family putative phage head morphogenesis protein